MRWRKCGLIFEPTGQCGWMNTHAQVPTALVLEDRIRVYFASRPQRTLSLPTFVDVDREDPSRILALAAEPILGRGRPGTFDADGVMPSAVVRDGADVLLYYSGWSRLGGDAPYNNATGLAISKDGGASFERVFEGPILDRAPDEPWSATSPGVIRRGREWYMWYSSGTGWIEVDRKLEHTYVLKNARSADGWSWQRDGIPRISVRHTHESQTRPTVIEIEGKWHMWFSYRGAIGFRTTGETYRMGHATSVDLETWTRDDESSNIETSDSGWDSQMVCYPEVVRVGERVLMFYNGNGFGERGFGYAVLENDTL